MADKIVYYNEYCKSCKHKNLPETEEPCDTCLENPVNEDSTDLLCGRKERR